MQQIPILKTGGSNPFGRAKENPFSQEGGFFVLFVMKQTPTDFKRNSSVLYFMLLSYAGRIVSISDEKKSFIMGVMFIAKLGVLKKLSSTSKAISSKYVYCTVFF